MKKIVWIVTLFWSALFLQASDVARLKAEIVKNMVTLLIPGPVDRRVYVDRVCPKIDFPVRVVGTLVTDPSTADVIITCDIDRSSLDYAKLSEKKKAIIVLSYRDYVRHKDIAAGAFFWQKGRPNIVLSAEYLQRNRIAIPPGYRPYVE